MTREISAGVLAWRPGAAGPEFLLVHPGGPYWAGKDLAAWSIPKGLMEPGEAAWSAARREFAEELGLPITGQPVALPPCRTPGGKLIRAFLAPADVDLTEIRSNTFEMEWPPRSGRRASFPEVDRAAYFDGPTALAKIHRGQQPIIEAAMAALRA